MKATKILATQHNVPAEEEGGVGRGDAGAARSPARSPQMEDMDQGKLTPGKLFLAVLQSFFAIVALKTDCTTHTHTHTYLYIYIYTCARAHAPPRLMQSSPPVCPFDAPHKKRLDATQELVHKSAAVHQNGSRTGQELFEAFPGPRQGRAILPVLASVKDNKTFFSASWFGVLQRAEKRRQGAQGEEAAQGGG